MKYLESAFNVLVMDNSHNSCPKVQRRLSELIGNYVPFHNVGMCDEAAVTKPFAAWKFDGIIHVAGLKAVGEFVKMFFCDQNNIQSTFYIVKAMVYVDCCNIVFSSSANVHQSFETRIGKTMSFGCTNPYGWATCTIEHILQDVAKANPNSAVFILRNFNLVGAHLSGRGIPTNLMPCV